MTTTTRPPAAAGAAGGAGSGRLAARGEARDRPAGGSGVRVNDAGTEPRGGYSTARPSAERPMHRKCHCEECGRTRHARADMERRVRAVVHLTADYFALAPEALTGRDRGVAWQRQVAMYAARRTVGAPLKLIGAVLGRDHTTVLHGVRHVEHCLTYSKVAQAHVRIVLRRAVVTLAYEPDGLDDVRHVTPAALAEFPFATLDEHVSPDTLARCPAPSVLRAYWRGRARGSLNAASADALAVNLLGLHPSLVWGDAWVDLTGARAGWCGMSGPRFLSDPAVARALTGLAWQADAACVDLDPRDFDHVTDLSMQTCPGCPVLRACRSAGMHPGQQRPERGAA